MFIRWLFTVFPTELRQGWRLVRPDLALWVALSALLGVAALSMSPASDQPPPLLPAVVGMTVGLVTAMLPAILFTAKLEEREITWGPALAFCGRKALPLFAYVLIAVMLAYGADSAVRVSVALVLRESPATVPMATLGGTVVLLSILVRFSFLPFLVLLSSRDEVPDSLWQWRVGEALAPWLWPLTTAARQTEGYRWRLVPYTVLTLAVPWLPALVAVEAALLVSVLGQILLLTVQAVFFDYYCVRCEDTGVPGPRLPPEFSPTPE